jgi:hypothetical protein
MEEQAKPEGEQQPQPSSGRSSPKVVPFDTLPQPLRKARQGIRDMMKMRCALPACPIPQKLARQAADWILMLCVVRANYRRKSGQGLYPEGAATLNDDISRSAEMVELVFVAAIEEAMPQSSIMVPTRG